MTLPNKPATVKESEKTIQELEKEKETLSKPSTLNGHTIATIPAGKYAWQEPKPITSESWESYDWQNEFNQSPFGRDPGFDTINYSKLIPGYRLAPGSNPPFNEWNPPKVQKSTVTTTFEPGKWVLDDPYKDVRDQLTQMENERYKRLGEIQTELGKKSGYAQGWQRSGGGKTGMRPGIRAGSTILTGGSGAYGTAQTGKKKLERLGA